MNAHTGYEASVREPESSESRTLARSIHAVDPERIFCHEPTTGFRAALPGYRRELAVAAAGFG